VRETDFVLEHKWQACGYYWCFSPVTR